MKESQNKIVLNALKNGPIDTVWAVKKHILRLAGRIKNLRDDGYNIESFPIYDKKGKKKPYCGYKLIDNIE